MAAGKAAPAPVRKPSFGTRAWRMLRLAVLWARRGAQPAPSPYAPAPRREFSIDETPAFRFRTPSARVLRLIPCIAPAVPDTPGLYGDDHRYFFRDADLARDLEENAAAAAAAYGYGADQPGSEYEGYEEELSWCGDDEQLIERVVAEACRASTAGSVAAGEGGEDAGVDVKADEFIARFYAQMKLQRQISWLQYNEMMQRSVS
ncbi:unnamed protein product [Urochloa decumbens]|uniref:Uncharacterized protein n=1 Tax=Urochloa decumbens TaxID=240449 RepID=A0ABC8ZRH2_9POAL